MYHVLFSCSCNCIVAYHLGMLDVRRGTEGLCWRRARRWCNFGYTQKTEGLTRVHARTGDAVKLVQAKQLTLCPILGKPQSITPDLKTMQCLIYLCILHLRFLVLIWNLVCMFLPKYLWVRNSTHRSLDKWQNIWIASLVNKWRPDGEFVVGTYVVVLKWPHLYQLRSVHW